MKSAALLIGLLFAAGSSDRLIGYLGQQAIHESQIEGANEREREQSLRRLFIAPAIKAHLEPFRSQWQLTEGEIEELILAYRESQLCSPPPPGPIADPKLRTQALKYWVSDHHADDLLPDPGADQAFKLDRLVNKLMSKCPRD